METPDVKYIDKNFDFDEYDGPFVIIPGTDFRYYPFEDIYQDLTETTEFCRLCKIKQLGTVGSSTVNACQDQDRSNHSYLAIDQSWACTAHPFEDMECIKQREEVFEQYKNIKFSDGEWVCEDLNGLLDLLKFRALMYSRIYMNPFNRAKEAFLIRRLKGEDIPLDEVIRWCDEQFDNWFRNKFGEHEFGLFFYISKTPFREIGREYNLTKLEQLRKEKEKGNVVVEYLKAPRNALKNFVLYKNEVRLLNEIPEYAERVKKIEDIIKKLNYIGVFEKATAEQNFDFRCSDSDLLDIAEGNIPQISR